MAKVFNGIYVTDQAKEVQTNNGFIYPGALPLDGAQYSTSLEGTTENVLKSSVGNVDPQVTFDNIMAALTVVGTDLLDSYSDAVGDVESTMELRRIDFDPGASFELNSESYACRYIYYVKIN